MIITNRYQLSECWIHAYRNLDYDSVGWRSVTGLIAPPRATLLKERHDEEITVDISDLMWLIIGSGVHAILERTSQKGIINEQRFIVNHHGHQISMKPDWLEALTPEWVRARHPAMAGQKCYRLDDFKVIMVSAAERTLKEGKFEYEAQLNLYRWGLAKQGFNVVEMNIQALLRDWSWRDAMVKHLYDLPPAARLPIPIWEMERTEAYLDERIALYLEAEKQPDTELPICSPQERWATPDMWKVIKRATGNTVPKGIAKTKQEAEAILDSKGKKKDEYDIKFCQGRSPRCDVRFCPGAPFCNIRHNFVKEDSDGTGAGRPEEAQPVESPAPGEISG